MIVVSNSSPIINLSQLDSLNILKKLFKKIYIPQTVYYEIANYNQPGAEQVKQFDWIIKKSITNYSLSTLLEQELDRGESEAITLAIELKSNLLLIDEKLGRLKADSLGIKYSGILGILLQAKSKNIITSVKFFLDDLINKAGFYVSKDVYNNILKLADE
ncbi:MAG: DUF3368 domain-containing protein [Spirochaetes bacterium]|nr:DUF3368 domain-containing protein [Spirochaetota bacterium]